MTLATVLIPTHDHGPTLLRSVPSALAQTVVEIEVFVVGDGVPDVTREIMAGVMDADERVRFFDNPKGPRFGELYRHAALQEAKGEIVCYLSDDDLWLPDHVQEMRRLLAEADVASSLGFLVAEDSRLHVARTDLSRAHYRELLLGGENQTHLSAIAHTLAYYRRLPRGWHPAPEGVLTDLHFAQQLLSLPDCTAAGGSRPTVWNFPSGMRRDWTLEQRCAELDEWAARLADPRGRLEAVYELMEATLPDRAWLAEAVHAEEQKTASARDELGAAQIEIATLGERASEQAGQLVALREEIVELRSTRSRLRKELVEADRALENIAASATWRLRTRLLAVPGLGVVLRWAAKALVGRAARGAAEPRRPAPTPGPSSTATESPAPDRPSDSPARRSDPSTR